MTGDDRPVGGEVVDTIYNSLGTLVGGDCKWMLTSVSLTMAASHVEAYDQLSRHLSDYMIMNSYCPKTESHYGI